MLRMLLWCAALAVCSLPARAEPMVTSTETVIRLTVQPMAAPKPALRYLLLPELKEMNPGNPIPNYLRCLFEQDFSANDEVLGRSALRQADRAARLDKPDWQILLQAKTEGIGLRLPDLQKLRTLARALQGRFRDEVALGHFDDAITTAKTMFAMSRHLSGHPTIIGNLVGVATANVAIVPLEEMLEQPGCPNLYWALTNLPNPLVPLDQGIEGERLLMMSEFRELDETAPMSADQLKQLIAHIDRVRAINEAPIGKDQKTRAWLDARVKDEKLTSAARRRLAEVGFSEARLLGFPAEQVILLDEKREYEVRRDEVMKLMSLPAWQAVTVANQAQLPEQPALFELLLPGLSKVRIAQGRLEQRIALLRHVEALRLYGAEHDGQLPEKLADIPLPLPVDPFTGKPIRYQREGATAHLRGAPPRGLEDVPAYNVHYEVTLQK